MRGFRNQGGSKRVGENRHRAGGKNPRACMVHVMTIMRTEAGINKGKSISARDAPIELADAFRLIFPTVLAIYLQFRGWVRQEAFCNGISVTFDLRQRARQDQLSLINEFTFGHHSIVLRGLDRGVGYDVPFLQ